MLLLLSLLLCRQVHPTSLAVNVFEVKQVMPLQPCVWYYKRNAKGVGRIQAVQHLLCCFRNDDLSFCSQLMIATLSDVSDVGSTA